MVWMKEEPLWQAELSVMPGCSTVMHASRSISPWSHTDEFLLLWLTRTRHHTKAGREQGTARGRLLLIIWKEKSVLGQIRAVAFFDIRLDRKGNCIFLKVNNQFSNWAGALGEQEQLSVDGCLRATWRFPQGGGLPPPPAILLVSLWREGRSLSGSLLPNKHHGHYTPSKICERLSGCWIHELLLKRWCLAVSLSSCLSTCAGAAIFWNPIPPAVSHWGVAPGDIFLSFLFWEGSAALCVLQCTVL